MRFAVSLYSKRLFIRSLSRRLLIAAKMEFRKAWMLVVLCSMLVGCRRDPYVDAYFDMLNAEKRILEDRLFEAEYNHEKALRELEACRTKPVPSRSRDQRDEDDRRLPPSEAPDLPEVEFPPGFSRSDGRLTDDRFRPVGTGVLPLAEYPSSRDDSIRPQVPDTRSPAQTGDQRVATISLNSRCTGGIDLDGMPGDDGLSVLVEPRNAEGQFVAQPAAVSLVLLDPLERGDRARFARWDFDRSAAQRMMKTQGLDRGLHIRVPWPDVPPTTDRLHLFVRYTTDDHRILESDREVLIRSPELVADRWTPRAENTASRTAGRTPTAPTRQDPQWDSQILPATHESPITETRTGSDPAQPGSSTESPPGRPHFWTPER